MGHPHTEEIEPVPQPRNDEERDRIRQVRQDARLVLIGRAVENHWTDQAHRVLDELGLLTEDAEDVDDVDDDMPEDEETP